MADVERLSNETRWVYDDPQECFDTVTFLHDRVHGKVEVIEKAQLRAAGFRLSDGTDRLQFSLYTLPGPQVYLLVLMKSVLHSPGFNIEAGTGPLGNSDAMPAYLDERPGQPGVPRTGPRTAY